MNVLLPVVVGGVIGILGGFVGPYFIQRAKDVADDRKWRRDKALDAYSEMVRAVEVVKYESDFVYHWECGTETHFKRAEILLESVAEMYRIQQRVFLLAPNAVNARLLPLTSQVGVEIAEKSIKCPKIAESEREAARKTSVELMTAFEIEARNDLALHPPLDASSI